MSDGFSAHISIRIDPPTMVNRSYLPWLKASLEKSVHLLANDHNLVAHSVTVDITGFEADWEAES